MFLRNLRSFDFGTFRYCAPAAVRAPPYPPHAAAGHCPLASMGAHRVIDSKCQNELLNYEGQCIYTKLGTCAVPSVPELDKERHNTLSLTLQRNTTSTCNLINKTLYLVSTCCCMLLKLNLGLFQLESPKCYFGPDSGHF